MAPRRRPRTNAVGDEGELEATTALSCLAFLSLPALPRKRQAAPELCRLSPDADRAVDHVRCCRMLLSTKDKQAHWHTSAAETNAGLLAQVWPASVGLLVLLLILLTA
jgi:hypothetical protein